MQLGNPEGSATAAGLVLVLVLVGAASGHQHEERVAVLTLTRYGSPTCFRRKALLAPSRWPRLGLQPPSLA